MVINKKISAYNNSSRNGASVKYIVIHDTGVTGQTAKNNADYFAGGNKNASAHYFTDTTSIWQSVEDAKASWHCGDGGGKYGITNSNSIGIEMCPTASGIPEATQNITIELIKSLQSKYGISNANVVRHYDASRKNCPQYLNLDKNWTAWNAFKAKLTETATISNNTNTSSTTQASNTSTSGTTLYTGYSSKELNTIGQTWLNTYYPQSVDSIANLNVDGDAGAKTWHKLIFNLQRELMAMGYNTGGLDGKFGSKSKEAWRALPTQLNNHNIVRLTQIAHMFCGYYPATSRKDSGAIDGDFGTASKSACKLLQKVIGVDADGIFGKNTAYALYSTRPGQ